MTRPRAADDFATIRARMEEFRRERALASKKEGGDLNEPASPGRNLLRAGDSRQRFEGERWSAGQSSRRYGSGR